MAKKKEFVEGIDYVITIRKRKKFIKNPKKNIKKHIKLIRKGKLNYGKEN